MSEPLCQCGHTKNSHKQRAGVCTQSSSAAVMCDCTEYAPSSPPARSRDDADPEAEAWKELAEIIRVRREAGSDPGLVFVWDKWRTADTEGNQ